MNASSPRVSLWKGRPITDLSRDELIEVVEFLAQESFRMREERSAMWRHIDVSGYLKSKGGIS